MKRLIQWAFDAVANGDTQHTENPRTFVDVVDILNDSGYVTFHRDIDTFIREFPQAVHEPLDPEAAQ